MIKISVNTKEEKNKVLEYLSFENKTDKLKIISVENNIENYVYHVIQMAIMPQYDFDLEQAIKQALRHEPDVLIIEKGE